MKIRVSAILGIYASMTTLAFVGSVLYFLPLVKDNYENNKLIVESGRKLDILADQVDSLERDYGNTAELEEIRMELADIRSELKLDNPDSKSTEILDASGRDELRKANLQQVQAGIDNYYDDKLVYPPAQSYDELSEHLVPDYISVMPVDPAGREDAYTYSYTDKSYILSVVLEATGESYMLSGIQTNE